MSLAAAFLLAAATAQAAPVDAPPTRERGVRVQTADVAVTILRPAVLRKGFLVSDRELDAPRSQRRNEGGRVTYAFE
jgi:hypothetical protein